MAHRKHVAQRIERASRVVALLGLLVCACSDALQTADHRGRVIDVDTGNGIAGAIVVAKYMGSRGFEGSSSCNRVESAVSDQDGWFMLPDDPQAGPRLMEAYHPDYVDGYRLRYAVGESTHRWHVWEQKRDDNNNVISIKEGLETYPSRAAAQVASREWIDLYMKRFKGAREQRLKELKRLSGQGNCLASPQTSDGAVPFVQAIVNEERALGASEDELKHALSNLETAEIYLGRKGLRNVPSR